MDERRAKQISSLEELYEGVLFIFFAILAFNSEKLSEPKTDSEKEARKEIILLKVGDLSKDFFIENFSRFFDQISKEVDFLVEEIKTYEKTAIQ